MSLASRVNLGSHLSFSPILGGLLGTPPPASPLQGGGRPRSGREGVAIPTPSLPFSRGGRRLQPARSQALSPCSSSGGGVSSQLPSISHCLALDGEHEPGRGAVAARAG